MTSQSPGITAELSLEIAHLQAQLQHDSTTCRCTSPRMNTRGHRSQMSRTFPSLHLNANRNDPRHQSSPKFIEFNEHQIPKFSGFFTGIHKRFLPHTSLWYIPPPTPPKNTTIYTRKTSLVTQHVEQA